MTIYINELKLKDLHTLQTSSIINDICKPLQSLGISYFALLRRYNNNKVIRLSNQNTWTELYHNANFYDYAQNLKYTKSDYSLSKQIISKVETGNKRNQLFKEHGFEEGFLINIKHPNCIDFFMFCFDKDKYFMINSVLEQLNDIYQFIGFFYEKTFNLLESLYKSAPYLKNISLPESAPENDLFKHFREQIKSKKIIIRLNEEKVSLSHQQINVLYRTLEGMTAKDIAKEMELSFRTVQYYQKLLRGKFNLIDSGQNLLLNIDNSFKKILQSYCKS